MENLEYLQQLIAEMVSEFEGEIEVGEKFTFTHDGERFTGRVYERFNGHYVVAFEAVVCATVLGRTKQTLINRLNGQLPFTVFKIEQGIGKEQTIIATHSLSVSTIAADQLVQTLDSIAYQVREQRPILSRGETTRSLEQIWRDDQNKKVTEEFNETIDDDVEDLGDDSSSAQRARQPQIRHSSRVTESVLMDLRRLVGLEPVKLEVAKLVAAREFHNARVAKGLPGLEQSPHLVFTGNPGTGKTTVARMVADLYKALGILKKGHVVEADCSKLIAAYIGQTPIKTQRLCEEARGGVLFIDEAYGLTSHQNQGYGPEAIETLLKFMEDNRGDIVIIVAGYPVEMQGFLNANPGLRSRFDVVIDFPDYSTEELGKIFDLYLEDKKLVLTADARAKVEVLVNSWPRGRGFGNGREMRNLFNEVVRCHAVRVVGDGEIFVEDLTTLSADDIPEPGAGAKALSPSHGRGAYL